MRGRRKMWLTERWPWEARVNHIEALRLASLCSRVCDYCPPIHRATPLPCEHRGICFIMDTGMCKDLRVPDTPGSNGSAALPQFCVIAGH